MHVVKADATEAYDRAMLHSVWLALEKRVTPPALVKAYLRCALDRAVRFSALGMVAEDWAYLSGGLPSGSPASPVLSAAVLEKVL